MIIISDQKRHKLLQRVQWVEDTVIVIVKDIMYVIYDDGVISRYHVVDEEAAIKEIMDNQLPY